MHRSRRSFVLALSVILLLPSLAHGELSQGHAEHALPDALSHEEALWIDAEAYAAEYGTTVEEAHARLMLQDEARVLVAKAQAADHARFAGAWLEHAPAFRLVIQFTGGQSGLESIDSLASAAPLDVEIRTGAAYSLAALRAAGERIELSPLAGPNFARDIDVRSGVLVVSGPQEPSVEAVRAAESLTGVAIRYESATLAVDQHTYGGAVVGGCTTGFTVHHATGDGVVTAGHCDNNQWYHQPPATGIWYQMAWQSAMQDVDQDVQFEDSTHPEYPRFWQGAGFTDVWGQAAKADMLNDWVCHHGQGSGTSCGPVTSITRDPGDLCGVNGNGPCAQSWVQVAGTAVKCYGGDSGGPWYSGGLAYGIHKAGASIGPGYGQCFEAIFMAIEGIGPGLGLWLYVQ